MCQRARLLRVTVFLFIAVSSSLPVVAQESPSTLPAQSHAPLPTAPEQQPSTENSAMVPEAAATYDKAIFQKPIPVDQLINLNQFAGALAKDLMHDKQFKRLLKSFVPDCEFHYGRDMPLSDALDIVLKDSKLPVQIRENRYLLVSGTNGPYLDGRSFLWVDLKDGIGLAGFYFHPTNGEPTPSLVVASRQVKEQMLQMGQLPPAFAEDLARWTETARVPPITTRYFITGLNKRILLEHDENYCAADNPGAVAAAGLDCMQSNADAADLDVTAAYYLDQIHYATNGTAWMIGPDQQAWIVLRNNTCGGLANPLGCRIRMARQRTKVIIHRPHRQR